MLPESSSALLVGPECVSSVPEVDPLDAQVQHPLAIRGEMLGVHRARCERDRATPRLPRPVIPPWRTDLPRSRDRR